MAVECKAIRCNLSYSGSELVFSDEKGTQVCKATPYFSSHRGIFEGLRDLESFVSHIKGPVQIIVPRGDLVFNSTFDAFVQNHFADLTDCFAMFSRKDIPSETSERKQPTPQTPKDLHSTHPNSPLLASPVGQSPEIRLDLNSIATHASLCLDL